MIKILFRFKKIFYKTTTFVISVEDVQQKQKQTLIYLSLYYYDVIKAV